MVKNDRLVMILPLLGVLVRYLSNEISVLSDPLDVTKSSTCFCRRV